MSEWFAFSKCQFFLRVDWVPFLLHIQLYPFFHFILGFEKFSCCSIFVCFGGFHILLKGPFSRWSQVYWSALLCCTAVPLMTVLNFSFVSLILFMFSLILYVCNSLVRSFKGWASSSLSALRGLTHILVVFGVWADYTVKPRTRCSHSRNALEVHVYEIQSVLTRWHGE